MNDTHTLLPMGLGRVQADQATEMRAMVAQIEARL